MGSATSRFKEAMVRGDRAEAYELFFRRKAVRDGVEWNELLVRDHESTILHLAALHGMRSLYHELLAHGGMPDQRDKSCQNCLHLICRGARGRGVSEGEAVERGEMLRRTLEVGLKQMDVQHILAEKDWQGNTALHLAASNGLESCVQVLVGAGCNLFVTNVRKETAADCASSNGHHSIATALETKMVFTPSDEGPPALEEAEEDAATSTAEVVGMRDHDLRCLQDQLLIETHQLLGVPLFVAEALLRSHGWSKEALLEAWMEGPAGCCERAGVALPSNAAADELEEPSHPTSDGMASGECQDECGICLAPCAREVAVPCDHVFCKPCWQQYLHGKIELGEGHGIMCPAYSCYRLVPRTLIEGVVSRDMAQRFLSFDIKAFVDSNPHIRWCPLPGCGQAVSRAPIDALEASETAGRPPRPGVTVHCGRDHYFCWECGGEPHEPCGCELWAQWLEHVQTMQPKIGGRTASDLDEAESSKWLATRSKPCPKCRVPIERTEGCNHMVCRKCKFDFCWVCLEEWRLHGSSTGGYFECNRYDAQKKAQEMLRLRKDKVMRGFGEVEALSKFLHYYERFKGHAESLQLEQPFLSAARHKMVALAMSVQSLETSTGGQTVDTVDLAFIENAVKELLMCRRVLRASYTFAFYVEGNTARRYFENVQAALEQVTEMLAEAVARPHLRRPKMEIVRLTREATEKRSRLVHDAASGLPASTPPSSRRFLSSYPLGELSSSSSSSGSSPARAGGGARGGAEEELLKLIRELGSVRQRRSEQAQESDDEMQRVLAESRQEFESERQLKHDIELAKEMSMREEGPPPPAPSPPAWPPAWPRWVQGSPAPSPPASPHTSHSSDDWQLLPQAILSPPLPLLIPPLEPTHDLNDLYGSSPSNGDPLGEGEPLPEGSFGPLFGEEEDLRRAIELSMQGNATLDSNRLDDCSSPPPPPLPAELRHLLQSRGQQPGTHV